MKGPVVAMGFVVVVGKPPIAGVVGGEAVAPGIAGALDPPPPPNMPPTVAEVVVVGKPPIALAAFSILVSKVGKPPVVGVIGAVVC